MAETNQEINKFANELVDLLKKEKVTKDKELSPRIESKLNELLTKYI